MKRFFSEKNLLEYQKKSASWGFQQPKHVPVKQAQTHIQAKRFSVASDNYDSQPREYPITGVPKPRQTQSDKWNKRPAVLRYRAFADDVKRLKVFLPECAAHVTFVMPMPESWKPEKKSEFDGKPHQQKPDWDNLGKALCDAIYGEDSHIWDCRVTKIWGYVGKIVIKTEK